MLPCLCVVYSDIINYVLREGEAEYLQLAALERQRAEREKMTLEDQLADVSTAFILNIGTLFVLKLNPCPAEPGYTLSLQTV